MQLWAQKAQNSVSTLQAEGYCVYLFECVSHPGSGRALSMEGILRFSKSEVSDYARFKENRRDPILKMQSSRKDMKLTLKFTSRAIKCPCTRAPLCL